jgi:hypothetical protein
MTTLFPFIYYVLDDSVLYVPEYQNVLDNSIGT